MILQVALLPLALSQELCPNSTFDKETIEEFVVGHINDQRYKLLRGLQLNGPWQGKDKWTAETQGYGKKLPTGKTMNKLEWSCNLEKRAKAALDPKCTDVEPNDPQGKTGLFYKMDIDWGVPELTSAAWAWMEQIEKFAVSDDAISDKQVTFKDHALREYLNLMRPSTKRIGCAEALCVENGVNKYRAFCITDKEPLKDNGVVYKAGNGGCDKGEKCPKGLTCEIGMCAKANP
ncbi:hypothetical protein Aduo_003044 [Ancylostoma duodenale]